MTTRNSRYSPMRSSDGCLRRSQTERVDIINRYTRELKNSGYTRKRAREIVVCGLLGLQRKRLRRKREGQTFHRKGKSTLKKRNRKKMTGKTTWFLNKAKDKDEEDQKRKEWREREQDEKMGKDGGKQKTKHDPKAVIFVPYTPNSGLAKELREVGESLLNLSGMKIKIVEKAGVQLKNILVKTNPWAGTNCQREGCLPCNTREET